MTLNSDIIIFKIVAFGKDTDQLSVWTI